MGGPKSRRSKITTDTSPEAVLALPQHALAPQSNSISSRICIGVEIMLAIKSAFSVMNIAAPLYGFYWPLVSQMCAVVVLHNCHYQFNYQ
jgi:hypothetical protein